MTANQEFADEREQPDGKSSKRADGTTAGGSATGRSATRTPPSEKLGVPAVDASVPATLASPRSKLVYLYLRTTGGGSVREIADDLGMQLVATYPALDVLAGRGLVVRDGETFRCV